MKATSRPAWMERPTATGLTIKGVFLVALAVLFLFPFLSVIATSLATEKDISSAGGLVLWPAHPTLDAYRSVFAGNVVARAMLVSLGVTLVGTAMSVAVTVGLAYALSRRIVGGRVILLGSLFTLLFAPGIIPSYLTVRGLHLLNNYAALILPVMVSGFNLVVLRQFFIAIPRELIDAARIDGANDWRILTHIVLPLSKAPVAVVSLFYAVSYWNAFFNAMLYLNDTIKWPLQLVVRQYVVQGASLADIVDQSFVPAARAVQMAVVVVAVLPILLLYPWLQRFFAKGVLSGAVKM